MKPNLETQSSSPIHLSSILEKCDKFLETPKILTTYPSLVRNFLSLLSRAKTDENQLSQASLYYNKPVHDIDEAINSTISLLSTYYQDDEMNALALEAPSEDGRLT